MGYSARVERSAARLPAPYVVALPACAEPPLLRQQEMVLDADVEMDVQAAPELEPLPDARLTFVMIAPLARDKGVFEFAEAARRLSTQQLDVRFVLVGAQQKGRGAVPRAQLEAWVREGRLDHFPDGDARDWMRKAHVVVLPAHRENCPRVVMEAMALGRPCIVSDAPGLAGLVTHYRDGVVVARESAAALAEGMTLIVRTPALLGPWSRAAAQTARAKFAESLRAGEAAASDPAAAPPNQAIDAAERPRFMTLAPLVCAISALVAGALLWETLKREDVAASAPRRVLAAAAPVATLPRADLATSAPNLAPPAGEPAVLEPVESAIVAPIVEEAARAKKERARLNARRRLDQLTVKRVGHLLDIEGEHALIEGRSPSFEHVTAGYAQQKAALLSRYNARIAAIDAERTALTARKWQRNWEVKRLSAQLIELGREEGVAEEELARRATLYEHGLTTRDHYDEAENEAAARRQQRLDAHDQLAHAESELAEVQRKLEELELKTRADAEAAIATHAADLAELDAALASDQRPLHPR